MHGVAGYALLSHEPARSALLAAVPIMVDLMVLPPKAEPKPPRPLEIAPPPKPTLRLAARPKPPEPQPVIAAPMTAPSPITAPPLPAEPQRHALLEPAPSVETPAPVAAPAPIGVTPPLFNADYLRNPPPAYPALSRRLGEEGRVVLRVRVNVAGSADEVQVRDSSGHTRLDDAARETVRRWKFVPARRGAQPIAAWVLVPISFRLEG